MGRAFRLPNHFSLPCPESDVLQTLGELTVNRSALCRRVLFVCCTVNDELWRENDLATFYRGFYQITISQAHLGAEAAGDGQLAFALSLHEGHKIKI